jgi:hypothetical protein
MAHWLATWKLTGHSDNPPHLTRIPARFEYLRLLQQETAYIIPKHLQETGRAYKRRVYGTFAIVLQDRSQTNTMRFERLEPHRQWTLIWKKLWNAPITMHTIASWYHIIHDSLPTNYRLHNIGTAQMDACHNCGGRDTLVHRSIECDPGPEQWDWMKTRITAKLLMDKNGFRTNGPCAPKLP